MKQLPFWWRHNIFILINLTYVYNILKMFHFLQSAQTNWTSTWCCLWIKFRLFEYFVFNLLLIFFCFIFVACHSNNTLYTFETSSIFCDEIVRLRKTQYLLDAKKPSHLIDYFYLQTIGIFIYSSDCREDKCFPNTVGEFKIRHLYSVILQYRLGIWSTGVANKRKTIQRLSFAFDASGMRSQQ